MSDVIKTYRLDDVKVMLDGSAGVAGVKRPERQDASET